ncbi:MAG: COX15/CtaA family protein [Flavobacteriaceae bacterium]|nr:COX15/CtaA family protein [Flavobacteriaceae bacterium]
MSLQESGKDPSFITFLQLIIAGLMAGMKAGLYYSTWPDMKRYLIPEILLDFNNWTWHNLTNYDSYLFTPALVQFLHRILAYVLLILTYYLFFSYRKQTGGTLKSWLNWCFVLINFQVLLGIATLFFIRDASIPVVLGVSHQLVGLLFYVSLLFLFFSQRKPTLTK